MVGSCGGWFRGLLPAYGNASPPSAADALRADARIGTADKFQGQEGHIVIVSLATTDLAEIPREMKFLYSHVTDETPVPDVPSPAPKKPPEATVEMPG